MSRAALQQLRRALPDRVVEDADSRFRASVDNLRLSFMPDAVVRVAREEEAGKVLKLAQRSGVPVTCRGSGSSTTGAAVPVRGGWVLDLSGLDRVEVDAGNRVAEVGAGALTADLQDRAAVHGLFYPPDPSSRKHSTLGGNIACNAGGMRCVKYGVTRDYVLGLRGFLADGRFVRWGLPVRKYVSGLNLRDLWIGSEGTLGVITGASLKLIPHPERRWMGLFAFASEAAALKAVALLFKEGHDPSILEFLDRQSVAGAERYTGRRILEGVSRPALLMVEVDGSAGDVRRQRKAVLDLMEPLAKAHREARTEAQAEALLQVRRTCSQAMFQLGDTKLNEDVVVPVDRQGELLRFTLELKKEIGLPTPTYGHAGDGNLHVHIMYNRGDAEQKRKAKSGIRRLMRKVVELGGVITGEHGIGLAKSPFMKLQHSAAEIEAMQAVREAFDPKGILNPGKIFEPFEVWKHEPVEVKLPWDHR